MRCILKIMIFLVCLLAARSGFSLDASRHRQLVVSVTDSWGSPNAAIYRFWQTDGRWTKEGKGMPAVVGERGLAWDPSLPDRIPGQPTKKEGDLRSPAGMFSLSGAMGFPPASPPGASLDYRAIQVGTHCVDDRDSAWYNRIIMEEKVSGPVTDLWRSSERMWQLPDLYRYLLLVDYNVRAPKPGDGSCIFMHIWRGPGQPTTGCTALAEDNLIEILRWLKPEADPALVQLPMDAYRLVWQKWRLPPPELLEEQTEKLNPLVDVRSLAPDVLIEMKYAGPDNFTGKTLYHCGRCFLRKGTAEKVAQAARELRKMKLSLKLWDCYRPLSVQKLFWSLVPDSRYVADPKSGSRHNRGTAVDVTLVDADGRELEMPTKFDDFSTRAGHGELDFPAKTLANRRLLAETMQKAGFRLMNSEWWHYDDAEGGGELLDVSFEQLCGNDGR